MKLERLDTLLADLAQQWTQAQKQWPASAPFIRQALEDIFELGLAAETGKDRAVIEKIRTELAKTAPLAASNIELIGDLVTDEIWKCYATWVHEDWQSWQALCLLRSQLEFMKQLYQPAIPSEQFATEDLRLLDKTIEEHCGGGYLPEEFIPYGVPPSHYWWWLPE